MNGDGDGVGVSEATAGSGERGQSPTMMKRASDTLLVCYFLQT